MKKKIIKLYVLFKIITFGIFCVSYQYNYILDNMNINNDNRVDVIEHDKNNEEEKEKLKPSEKLSQGNLNTKLNRVLDK